RSRPDNECQAGTVRKSDLIATGFRRAATWCRPGADVMAAWCWCCRVIAGRSSAEVVLLDIVAERPEAHAEQLRGLPLHAAGTLQRFRDVSALDLFDVGFEIEA